MYLHVPGTRFILIDTFHGFTCFLQTSVAPASTPRNFFHTLSTGDAQLSAANRAGIAVRVLATAVHPGHGPTPVLDGFPPEAHQRCPPSSPQRRFGGTGRQYRGRRRTAVPIDRRRFRSFRWSGRFIGTRWRRRCLTVCRRGTRRSPRIRRKPLQYYMHKL